MFPRKKQFSRRKDFFVCIMDVYAQGNINFKVKYGCRVWRGFSLETQVGEPVIYSGGNN